MNIDAFKTQTGLKQAKLTDISGYTVGIMQSENTLLTLVMRTS